MSKSVTVRRGEKLPENMACMPFAVPVNSTIIVRPGDTYPENACADSITVEVPDDPPPQVYLIVPCEKGKGTHWVGFYGVLYHGPTSSTTHKQIPCALTLEDLVSLYNYTLGTRPTTLPPEGVESFKRLANTIAAWSAVPQPREAGR